MNGDRYDLVFVDADFIRGITLNETESDNLMLKEKATFAAIRLNGHQNCNNKPRGDCCVDREEIG